MEFDDSNEDSSYATPLSGIKDEGNGKMGEKKLGTKKLFGHKRLKRKKNSQPVHWPTVDSEPDDDNNDIDAADLYISGGYDTEFDK